MKEEEKKYCVGFVENIVLAVKTCFMHRDMKQILIEKCAGRVVYHHRDCSKSVYELVGKVSPVCNNWFNSLNHNQQGKYYFDGEDPREHLHSEFSIVNNYRTTTSNVKDKDAYVKEEENVGGEEVLPSSDTEQNDMQMYCEMEETEDQGSPEPEDEHTVRSQRHSMPSRSSATPRRSAANNSQEFVCALDGCLDQTFTGKARLREHMKLVHNLPKRGRKPVPTDSDLAEGDTKCKLCSKEFENKTLLARHIKRHTTSRQPCHICGQMVKELQVHIKIQHTEKDKLRYFCEFCARGFKGYSAYAFHLAGHTGERKYPCATCGKNYRTSSEQKKCEQAHQGLFKWNCSHCSYRTHQKNKYVRHLRTHTKSEPFLCPLCDQRAARKDYLQKHIAKVHDSMTLEQIEKLHPEMYNIDEKISVVEGDIVLSSSAPRKKMQPLVVVEEPESSSTQLFLLSEHSHLGSRLEAIKKQYLDREEWKVVIN